MKRTVCKPRDGPVETRRLVKPRDATYEVSLRSSPNRFEEPLDGFFRHDMDGKTTWLITEDVRIGVQNKHIDELGINMLNFMEPHFVEVRNEMATSADRFLMEVESSSSDAGESIDEENVCQILKQDVATDTAEDALQQLLPRPASRVRGERLQKLKPNAKVFKWYKLQKLLGNEHVKQISSRELKDRIKSTTLKALLLPNRVVKKTTRDSKKVKKAMIAPRHKKRIIPGSERIVHWISVEQQKLITPKYAQLIPALKSGNKITFELIKYESNKVLMKEYAQDKAAAATSIPSIHLCYILLLTFIVALGLPKLIRLCDWPSRDLESGCKNTCLRLAFYVCHIFLLAFIKST